jgi:uncharacterized membrane protein
MTSEPAPLFCANHPTVETTLRCNRCEKPICTKCAVLTPTGYRCKECVRNQQKTFNTAEWYDYVIAIPIAAILAFIGSRISSYIGFFTIFVAPIAGMIIAEAVRAVTRKHRSKALFMATAVAAAVGSLIPILLNLTSGFLVLFPLIWQGAYAFIVTSTVLYRLRGIRL